MCQTTFNLKFYNCQPNVTNTHSPFKHKSTPHIHSNIILIQKFNLCKTVYPQTCTHAPPHITTLSCWPTSVYPTRQILCTPQDIACLYHPHTPTPPPPTHTHTHIRVIAFDRGRTMYVCVLVCECVCVCNCNTEDVKLNTEDTLLKLYLLATTYVYIIVQNLQTRTFSIYPHSLFTVEMTHEHFNYKI